MKTVGLTGGIGSGKSVVACIFKQMGFPVYIADTEASRLINSHPQIRREIQALFGETIYGADGKLIKTKMAEIIFHNPQALAQVNQIVHPFVIKDFNTWCKQQNQEIVFFESAIIFEAELDHFFDLIICVTASEETRIKRVKKRDHTTTEKVMERIKNQKDDSEKCKKADFIIYNEEQDRVVRQIIEVVGKVKSEK